MARVGDLVSLRSEFQPQEEKESRRRGRSPQPHKIGFHSLGFIERSPPLRSLSLVEVILYSLFNKHIVQPYDNLNKSQPHLELIGWFPPSNSMQMGCDVNITMKPLLEVLFEIGNKVSLVDKGLNNVQIEVDAVCITPNVFEYKTQNMSKANTENINWWRQ